MKKLNPDKQKLNSFIRYSSLGFEMMAIIALGTFGGYKLDNWLQNSFRVFTLSFMVISVVFSMVYVIRNLIKK